MATSALDPLLQPFTLSHVHLRNRVVSTSHEPAYAEDGLPKDRYRAYHVEKARGGVGLTMIRGSAVVSPDSPPAFGNLLLYRDEIVPWLRLLADEIHAAGAAVMCQITHLGRRTSNYSGDWLPLVYRSPLREPAHRSFPKAAENWDLTRIVEDYAAAARRCRDAGLDGIEIEAYSHLFDAFLSPASAFPISSGRTLVRTPWLVHEDAVEGVDYDVDALTHVWRQANEQDANFVARAQLGISCPVYEPGPYMPSEYQVDALATWYVDRLQEYLSA